MVGIPVQHEQTEVCGISAPKHPAIVFTFGVLGFRPVLTRWCLQEMQGRGMLWDQEGNIVGMLLQDVFGAWQFGLHAVSLSFVILLFCTKLLIALALADSVSLSN